MAVAVMGVVEGFRHGVSTIQLRRSAAPGSLWFREEEEKRKEEEQEEK